MNLTISEQARKLAERLRSPEGRAAMKKAAEESQARAEDLRRAMRQAQIDFDPWKRNTL